MKSGKGETCVRFLTVVAVLIGAAWVAGIAVRDGSPTMFYMAGGLVLLALIVAVSGGRRRRARKAAEAAAAAAAKATASQPQNSPAPAPALASEVVPAPAVSAERLQEASLVVADVDAGPESDPVREPAEPDDDVAVSEPPTDTTGSVEMTAPAVRTPFSVQPAVVLMSLYDAVAERYQTDCAHLWLEDSGTATLRMVAAFGPRVPKAEPVHMDDPILGACASTRTAVFRELAPDDALDDKPPVWRYAVPVGTPEVRGVAAVDLAPGDPGETSFVLNEVSAALRASLTAALAVHVARAEMDTAVQLLRAAQELTSGIGADAILTSALDHAMTLSGATTGSIMLPHGPDGALRIVASRGLPADVVTGANVANGEGIAGTVYSSSAPLLVEDLPGRAGESRHGVHSSVSIPIADEKGTLGVLNVGARAFPARLTDAYVRALGLLGSQTATAMRNDQAAERSWDTYLMNLQALASALESDDPYRRGASKRTADLAVALGEEMGLAGDDLLSLRIAAILHDVGMGLGAGSVGATDRPLSTVDRGLVRAHPKLASDVLQQVPSLEELAPVVRHHHERYDGEGYDTGLSGASIPLGSRILAVVDAFVAMTAGRPYRQALSVEAALAELDGAAGAQFDPLVVESFIVMLANRPELVGTL